MNNLIIMAVMSSTGSHYIQRSNIIMMEKSKKDIAFDKERAKYRKKIRDLEREVKCKYKEISELKDDKLKLEEEIREKDNQIERLMEYMDLSYEDMKKLIKRDRLSEELSNIIAGITDLYCKI